MIFEVNGGEYWADEISHNGNNNWLYLCDDEYRFFFIQKSDCRNIEYADSHLYN